ncbi:MAG: DUF2617 family protein [Planctomycetes bacterium]|nr:DUF2617 family protein [Planctomycetota bacterium]
MSIRQRQCVSEMRMLLYSRSLHPELFDIYHDHHIIKDAYEAQIWVTGMSHLITFYHNGSALTELLAGSSIELPERGLLAAMKLRGEKDHRIENIGGIAHLISFQVEAMSPKLYERTHLDMIESSRKGGIFLTFPQWTGSHSLEPFTYIDYEAKVDNLHVFAYHAYPDELTLIKTQSIFELA